MSQQSIQSDQDQIGPVALEPIFQERIWGVERLPDWYPQPPAGKPIGEAWLTAETCVASDGAFKGLSLAELTRRYPEAFAGGALAEFPLLIKTLFPREKLSVQVHPNDAEAQALGMPRGKTECWYVLSAEPGAALAVGFREELTPEQIRKAIEDKTLEDKLRYLQVKAGDMVFVAAGTVHAIGPGVVVLETQQYSDTTYRLYDYGRPRELHVEAGLAVSRTNDEAGLTKPVEMDGFVRLIQSAYFAVDRFSLAENVVAPLGSSGRMQLLFATSEGCSVISNGAPVALEPGRVVVLPRENVEYRLRSVRDAEVIRILQP